MSSSPLTSRRHTFRSSSVNRFPTVVTITLGFLAVVLLYNFYANSSARSVLQNDVQVTNEQLQDCQQQKLGLQQRTEQLEGKLKAEQAKGETQISHIKKLNDELLENSHKLAELKKQFDTSQKELSDAKNKLQQLTINESRSQDVIRDQIRNLTDTNVYLKSSRNSLLQELESLKNSLKIKDGEFKRRNSIDSLTRTVNEAAGIITNVSNNETTAEKASLNNGDWQISDKLLQEKKHIDQSRFLAPPIEDADNFVFNDSLALRNDTSASNLVSFKNLTNSNFNSNNLLDNSLSAPIRDAMSRFVDGLNNTNHKDVLPHLNLGNENSISNFNSNYNNFHGDQPKSIDNDDDDDIQLPPPHLNGQQRKFNAKNLIFKPNNTLWLMSKD